MPSDLPKIKGPLEIVPDPEARLHAQRSFYHATCSALYNPTAELWSMEWMPSSSSLLIHFPSRWELFWAAALSSISLISALFYLPSACFDFIFLLVS